jgi:hypothetical protein
MEMIWTRLGADVVWRGGAFTVLAVGQLLDPVARHVVFAGHSSLLLRPSRTTAVMTSCRTWLFSHLDRGVNYVPRQLPTMSRSQTMPGDPRRGHSSEMVRSYVI